MTSPKCWDVARFHEITPDNAPIIYGILQPGPMVSDGVPYIRPSEIEIDKVDRDAIRKTSKEIANRYARSTLKAGDLILSIVGTIGKVAEVPLWLEGGNITQSSCRIRPHPELVSKGFLKLYLTSPAAKEQFAKKKLGTAVPRLNIADIRNFELPFPPLDEQRRIVARLDALIASVNRARAEMARVSTSAERLRMTTLKQAVTGMLTKSWRGRNGEVETVGEMLCRVPPPDQGRGGREATDKVIPGRGGLSVNDPASSLPSGWQWVPLLRLAKQETGHTPSRSQPSYWDGGVPWVGIRDAGAHHGRTIDKTAQTISEEGLANSSARLLPAGTVCLSRTASVGYVTILGRTMATSQDFATWTCSSALLPEYLMLALLAEGDDIRKFGMGSTHTTIYFPEIRALQIALPPLVEQHEIIARAQVALARADRLEVEAARATKLLDRLEASILTKAFRGELVSQDPADEPASALLDRIRVERASSPKPRRGRGAVAPVAVQS